MAGDHRRSVVVLCVEVASVAISRKEEAKQAKQWEVDYIFPATELLSLSPKFGCAEQATFPNLTLSIGARSIGHQEMTGQVAIEIADGTRPTSLESFETEWERVSSARYESRSIQKRWYPEL